MHNTLISELESLQPTALDAGLVFSGKASGRLIQGYALLTAYTPTIDHNYLFHESSRDIIVWLMNPPQSRTDPLYVFGPTGCGKTSCIKQLVARLNYPVFEVTGHGRLEFADLAGHLAVKDGSMVYEYDPLALAMRYGGILLLNEIDLTSPEVAAGLNTVLDGSPLCIAENDGELIAPHPMFRFVAIRILDSLLALNLNISLWSARKKLTPQDFGKDDFGNVELPPEDLATLGSKRIAPPESLRIFGTLNREMKKSVLDFFISDWQKRGFSNPPKCYAIFNRSAVRARRPGAHSVFCITLLELLHQALLRKART